MTTVRRRSPCPWTPDVVDALTDAAQRPADDAFVGLARRHVLVCLPCREATRRVTAFEQAYRDSPPPAVDPAFHIRLANTLAGDGRGMRRPILPALLCAAVILLAVFGLDRWASTVRPAGPDDEVRHMGDAARDVTSPLREPRTAYVGWNVPVRAARLPIEVPGLDAWLANTEPSPRDPETWDDACKRFGLTSASLEHALMDRARGSRDLLEPTLAWLVRRRAFGLDELLEHLARDPHTEPLALRAAAQLRSRRAIALLASRYPETRIRIAWLNALRIAREARLTPLLETVLDDGTDAAMFPIPKRWNVIPGLGVVAESVSRCVHRRLLIEASLAQPETPAVDAWFSFLQRDDLGAFHEALAQRIATCTDLERRLERWSKRLATDTQRRAFFRVLAAGSDGVSLDVLRTHASSPTHRSRALCALVARIDQPEALGLLVAQWALEPHFETDVSRAVRACLRAAPEAHVSTLRNLLATASEDRRRIALLLLARSSHDEAWNVLEHHLERGLDREALVIALALSKDVRAVALLERMLDDRVFGDAATLALGIQGSQAARQRLEARLHATSERSAPAWVAWLRIVGNESEPAPDVREHARVLGSLTSYGTTPTELATVAREARRRLTTLAATAPRLPRAHRAP